jgi:rhodanese-related sulfurtransferase
MDFIKNIFNGSTINQLDPEQVQELLSKTPRPYLLDVRTPGEYKQGHISGAELIPLDELMERKGRIPRDRQVICICASGSRSNSASRQLNSLGYQVSNMRGGMSRWARVGLPMKTGMGK